MDRTTTPAPPKVELKQMKVKDVIQEMMKKKMKKIINTTGCSGCLIPKKVEADEDETLDPNIIQNKNTGTSSVDSNIPGGRNVIENKDKAAKKTTFPTQNSAAKNPESYNTQQISGKKVNVSNNASVQNKLKNNPNIDSPETRIGGGLMNNKLTSTPEKGTPVSKEIDQFMKHNNVMTMEDLMGILYKFNYTLTYHGHHETGNRAGDKEGGYFFNGRDGFGRDVKYIANEFGYQPNITLVDLTPEETPKEHTEKELTVLKGNEFKWYY